MQLQFEMIHNTLDMDNINYLIFLLRMTHIYIGVSTYTNIIYHIL